MADKVKEVAVGEADRIKSLTIQAARSAAYLYPIKVNRWNQLAVYCLQHLHVYVLIHEGT